MIVHALWITVALVYLTLILYILQVVTSSTAWDHVPRHLKPSFNVLVQLLMRSRAESTIRAYLAKIKAFSSRCRNKRIPFQLPIPSSVAFLYLADYFEKSKSGSSFTLVHAALKWFHSLVPGPNSFDSTVCHNILESSKRSRTTPIKKKAPFTSDMVKKVIDKYAHANASLSDLRIASLCALGFAGFFRFNEIVNILPKHLELHDDFLKIFIPRSKTDVYREGNFVFIRKISGIYCPVNLILRYVNMAGVYLDSDLPLFRGLTYHKSSNTYSLRSGKLSYSRCREIFKDCVIGLGYDDTSFGLHSLRSGGITPVVCNSNNSVSRRLLKLHGRWKTDLQ